MVVYVGVGGFVGQEGCGGAGYLIFAAFPFVYPGVLVADGSVELAFEFFSYLGAFAVVLGGVADDGGAWEVEVVPVLDFDPTPGLKDGSFVVFAFAFCYVEHLSVDAAAVAEDFFGS